MPRLAVGQRCARLGPRVRSAENHLENKRRDRYCGMDQAGLAARAPDDASRLMQRQHQHEVPQSVRRATTSVDFWREDELEYTPCNICRTDNTRVLLIRDDALPLVRCRQCDLAYIDPRPKGPVLAAIYSAGYFTGNGRIPTYQDYVATELKGYDERSHLAFLVLDRIARLHRVQGSTLLDVGCGIGTLLRVARDRGAAGEGIDISSWCVDYGRNNFGLRLETGRLENVYAAGPRFDTITCIDVIEHVPDPTAALQAMADLLKPQGIICLLTPNFRCYERYGPKWLPLHANLEHLYYFDRDTLGRAGRLAGLDAVYWETLELMSRPMRVFLMNCLAHGFYDLLRRWGERVPALYHPARRFWQTWNRGLVNSGIERPHEGDEWGISLLVMLRKGCAFGAH